MLWVKTFHIIALIAWFSGLFYLPRLFVYHAEAKDAISLARFKIMEHRLYRYIMWPAAISTLLLGVWLLSFNLAYYLKAGWLHAKLTFVFALVAYHIYLGRCLRAFKEDRNQKTAMFFRILNEIPTVFLVAIVILVVVKPF